MKRSVLFVLLTVVCLVAVNAIWVATAGAQWPRCCT